MFVQDIHHEADSEWMANIRADNENVLSKYTGPYASAPLLVPPSLVTELSDFYTVLIKIIHQVVKNYFDDNDINSVISFEDKRILNLLSCLNNNRSYQIGALRPDFIISYGGDVKLCEINARFVCNGIICSEYLYPYYASRFNLMPAGSGMLAKYLQMFDLTKNICILKGKEPGLDIFFLQKELSIRMIDGHVIMATPQQLELIDDNIYVNGEKCDQFILELHQSELIIFDDRMLERLFMSNVLNDFRTIMIVHDKRLFSLLSNHDFLCKYLTKSEADLLLRFIPQTFLFSLIDPDLFLKEPEKWVLKKSDSGKGDGMYICSDMTPQKINQMLTQKLDNYIMQEYIYQEKKSATFIDNEKLVTSKIYFVGALVSFNDTYHGLSIVRGSAHKDVSVAQGAAIFVPMMRSNTP